MPAQAAALWIEEDGNIAEFEDFCYRYFIGNEKQLDDLFDKFDKLFESFEGHFNAMRIDLRESIDLDTNEISPVDRLTFEYDPSSFSQ